MNHLSTIRRTSGKRRKGIAFLMLAVMILLVIVAAARTMIVSEVATRRAEASADRLRDLNRAIARATAVTGAGSLTINLPLHSLSRERIEIAITDDRVRARWISGDQVVEEVIRNKTDFESDK